MVRDDDLVREILLRIEAAQESPLGIPDLNLTAYDPKTIGYHLVLLEEAGLIVATFAHADNVVYVALIDRLTWDGHEFLDAIRSDSVWSQTKTTVAKTIGSASLEVIKAAATAIALKQLGL